MQDSEIIGLYFDRNENAIGQTAKKYGAYCHTVAMNILKDIFESEECVNDTYFRAWNSIPPTRPTKLGAFLAKITRNLALDRYDKRRAQKRGSSVPESLDELGECIGEERSDLSFAELGSMISEFLRGEKELARKLFVRRYFYENSVKELSYIFGISESSVKTTLHRTRLRLADYLKEMEVYL